MLLTALVGLLYKQVRQPYRSAALTPACILKIQRAQYVKSDHLPIVTLPLTQPQSGRLEIPWVSCG